MASCMDRYIRLALRPTTHVSVSFVCCHVCHSMDKCLVVKHPHQKESAFCLTCIHETFLNEELEQEDEDMNDGACVSTCVN